MTRLLALAAVLLPAADAERPEWIWTRRDAADGEVAYFRKAFSVAGRPAAARLVASCDNRLEVFLNGKPVGTSADWRSPLRSDVLGAMTARDNVLAVRGENEGGAAGLVVRLDLEFPDKSRKVIVSDESWQVSDRAPRGWETREFDASAWKPAVRLGALGAGPWGDVFAAAGPAAGQAAPPPVTALEGFKVEVLYTVPKEQGSWVCMTFDPKGRLIVSPQDGNVLYRLAFPAGGGEPQVEKIQAKVGSAQGLLHAFGSLYVTGNGPQGTAFYRLKETGDSFEDAVCLKKWPGGMGEHGPHAILLGPDRKLYCVIGNHVKVPPGLSERSPHRNYQEDLLLPRLWDPNGHAVGCLAPGGYFLRTDPEGKEWEMWCGGFRNQYDAAFSPEGELFTYDSDMEWDIGTPWYRPTRVYHLVQGGEYGWRSASGKWPAWYPDNLPMVLDVGLGSPTGLVFGTGAKFPPKYRRALYALDWAYGKIYAVHLKASGASYEGRPEVFVQGKPLNVADVEIGPDGAMYFVCGGRGTQSRLYRVTYTGPEVKDEGPGEDPRAAELRALRRRLEAFHGRKDPDAVKVAWPYLNHADRWVRFAARIAIEHQDVELWKHKALNETLPAASLEALLALSRCGGKELLPRVLESLGRLGVPWDKIGEDEKVALYRVYQVAFCRMGPPDEAWRKMLIERFDKLYPAPREIENRELCQLLVYLGAPTAVPKTLALLARAESQQEQLHYAFHLRNVKQGWTVGERRAYFEWINRALKTLTGGHSFLGFIRNIRTEVLAALSEAERKELDAIIAAGYLPPKTNRAPAPVVQKWTMDDLLPELDQVSSGRSFNRGRDAFARAQCLACHRFGAEGGSVGPDLTAVASRFSRKDLLESIVLSSKVISDQYNNTLFQKADGDVLVGRVVKEDAEKVYLRTDPLDDKITEVRKKDIRASKPSPVSPMPDGLLDTLRKPEIWDLLAYLESGGNPNHANFKKKE
jgi:putative heme-binding domain-containing protein